MEQQVPLNKTLSEPNAESVNSIEGGAHSSASPGVAVDHLNSASVKEIGALQEEHQDPSHNEQNTTTQDKAILETLQEIKQSLNKFETAIFDPKNGIEVLLAKTITRVDNIHSEIHGAVNGIKVRLEKMENVSASAQLRLDTLETSVTRLTKMLDENKQVAQQLSLMQGMLQRISQQGSTTSAKINDLTKRGMEQNLLLYGIEEVEGRRENYRESVLNFLSNNLEIEIKPEEIWKAHRLGLRRDGYVRPMVVKLAYHIKERVMENLSKLKGKVDPVMKKPLFISEQVPEAITEAKKQLSARHKKLTEKNDALPRDQQKKIVVQNNKILINGELTDPEITTPQPSDLFMDHKQQCLVNAINQQFVMTEPHHALNSEFIALAIKVNKVEQVRHAYKAAMQRFPAMDHVMMAYAFKENEEVKMGHCDDGEHGGGQIIRKTMATTKAKDTAIFVVRRFGGLHMGPERFRSIEKVSLDALNLLNKK